MKKFLLYLTVCVVIVATSCTNFGEDTQLSLPDASLVEILDISSADSSITFRVAPKGESGFYSWMVVAANEASTAIQPERVLNLTAGGLANGIANYDLRKDTVVTVKKLLPYTVYQIYAVTASKDGIVSTVKNASIRTKDDGSVPKLKTFAIKDSVVTITFQEPLQRGTGKVYVSYFAKNTVSGHKPLKIAAGYEEFNPQDVVVDEEQLSVSGTNLVIKLPKAPAGVYASVTFDEGAVLDMEGNKVKAYVSKADTLRSGVPSRGITVQVANKTWKLRGEFADIKPDTVAAFTVWNKLSIVTLPDTGIVVRTKTTKIPTVTFNQPTKSTIINVSTWAINAKDNVVQFSLPEEPARGATVDITVPKGAVEDVYGNQNEDLTVKGNYLYSYGYTLADVIGTYDVALVSNWDGPLPVVKDIVIAKHATSDTLLLKNLFMKGTQVKGVLNPVLGTISVPLQTIAKNVDFGASGTQDVVIRHSGVTPIVFNVPAAGKITSPAQIWGYYVGSLGWYDAFTASTWTRSSTSVPAAVAASVLMNEKTLEWKPDRILGK